MQLIRQLKCWLLGGHEYTVRCETGTVRLRCQHCGRGSSGWPVLPSH